MPQPLSSLTSGRPAIVTGQQAGLGGGPLYTLYKLLGTIALAAGRDAVPVFWIECDDADIQEVDQLHWPDGQGQVKTLTTGAADDGRSVGGRQLGPGITAVVAELRTLCGDSDAAQSALADLETSYLPGATWQAAFAQYLGLLTAPRRVHFFDPTEPAAKAAAQPLFARVIDLADQVEQALAGAATTPTPQVPYAPGELPLFVLDDQGRRRKLLWDGKSFALKGTPTSLSRAELDALLDREPTRFSPSVLLRPVLQDWLLPTAGYLAGPSERRYHEQLPGLYALLEVNQPALFDRPSFTLLDPRARRLLDKLEVTADEALDSGAELATEVLKRRGGIDPIARAATTGTAIAAALQALREELAPIDPGSLDRAFDDASNKIAFQVDKLGQRATDALSRRDQATTSSAQRLLALLQPTGLPQERVLPALFPLTRLPARDLVERLLDAIDPSKPGRHQFIELA